MQRAPVVHHLVDIDPPNIRRDTWLAVCSEGDFTQSYLYDVDAHIGAQQHIIDMRTVSALERGIYKFGKAVSEKEV